MLEGAAVNAGGTADNKIIIRPGMQETVFRDFCLSGAQDNMVCVRGTERVHYGNEKLLQRHYGKRNR